MRGVPEKAFVLAAGLGTRMQPLTRDLPKPLLPVWGRPALARILDLVASWGVRDVLVNIHHKPDPLLEFIQSWSGKGLRIALSFEPEILGTGGALRKGEWFLDEKPFWLINSDIVADVDPMPMWKTFCRKRPLAVLWMHPTLGPRTVEVREDGTIRSFRSDTPGREGTRTFCGLHLLTRRVLSYLPEEPSFASIVPAYERAMDRGQRVYGVSVPGAYWADIGTPEQYLNVHRELLERYGSRARSDEWIPREMLKRVRHWRSKGVHLHGFAALGDGVRLAKGVRLENTVLWDGATCRRGSRVRDAVVGRGVSVHGAASHVLVPAALELAPAEQRAVKRRGWVLEKTVAQCLPARGSARSFIRLVEHGQRAMLIRYLPDRRENAYYARHARFLKELGLRVPEVLVHDPRNRFLLMEDMGDRSLADVIRDKPADRVAAEYIKVLDRILLLHREGIRAAAKKRLPLMPEFSDALFQREHDLFLEQFVTRWFHIEKRVVTGLRKELRDVAARLMREPWVLIHRDLQSSNILFKDESPVFIDFQGMRKGPASYDLASLLCDPYVELSPTIQDKLGYYYMRRAGHCENMDGSLWWAAIQRLVQALGAYGRLSALPGCERFVDHIPPALRLLKRALVRGEACPRLLNLADQWLGKRDAFRARR